MPGERMTTTGYPCAWCGSDIAESEVCESGSGHMFHVGCTPGISVAALEQTNRQFRKALRQIAALGEAATYAELEEAILVAQRVLRGASE